MADRAAISRKRASLRNGAPPRPPAPITLDRAPIVHRPPTLLLAVPFLLLGGAERLLSTIVGHLVQMGWRVVITTSIEPGSDHGDTTPWFEQHTGEEFRSPSLLSSGIVGGLRSPSRSFAGCGHRLGGRQRLHVRLPSRMVGRAPASARRRPFVQHRRPHRQQSPPSRPHRFDLCRK